MNFLKETKRRVGRILKSFCPFLLCERQAAFISDSKDDEDGSEST